MSEQASAMTQGTLFPMDDAARASRLLGIAAPAGLAPSADEMGEALLAGAKLAVNKRLFWGQVPKGLGTDDLVSEIVILALPRARRYRTGKIKLANYCYVLACHCLTDWFRARARHLKACDSGARDLDVYEAEDTISLFDAGIERGSA
jgi:hypothetical protein